MQGEGVLEEEDFEVEPGGNRNYVASVYVVVLVRVLEEVGEGIGEFFGVVELGVGGGEGDEVVQVGEEGGSGWGVAVVAEGGGVGVGEYDGVVGVAVAVLEGSPFCGHGLGWRESVVVVTLNSSEMASRLSLVDCFLISPQRERKQRERL